jgi:hypothetical protein
LILLGCVPRKGQMNGSQPRDTDAKATAEKERRILKWMKVGDIP